MCMKVTIIGYDSGWGCRDWGCEDGPNAADRDSILSVLDKNGISAAWHPPLGLKTLADHKGLDHKDKTLAPTLESLRRLYHAVTETLKNGSIPVVIGGDHSSALATWSAIAKFKKIEKRMGLVWIDAHLDCHTYDTSFQGKFGGWWHGQPVTALMGHGKAELTAFSAPHGVVSPEHLTFIGTHSFEPLEIDFVRKHNIRVTDWAETTQKGFDVALKTALARAQNNTSGFGMTIDLDVFRPEDAPGVGSPEDKGLIAAQTIPHLRGLAYKSGFLGIEIVEHNPKHDIDRKTSRLITEIISQVFERDG
jgi:arginase